MIISHCDPRLSWHGHISLERTAEYSRPWRIPFDKKALFHPGLVAHAATQAGVRLSLHSDTTLCAGKIVPFGDQQKIDLYINGAFHGTSEFRDGQVFEFKNLPSGQKRLELWLPQCGDFALRELEIESDATLQPFEDRRPRWVVYGSSITHCSVAASPSHTWPAIVARRQNLNLTCLGYGGQCHLDPQIACMMRDLPAAYFTLKVGINIYGLASLNERTFGANLIGFVQILREKHPRTPIALVSPIYGCERETTANAVGWTLQDYRNAVAQAAQTLMENGDENIVYADGLNLFDNSFVHLLPDNLHPNADGYKLLGENFLQHVAPALFGGH